MDLLRGLWNLAYAMATTLLVMAFVAFLVLRLCVGLDDAKSHIPEALRDSYADAEHACESRGPSTEVALLRGGVLPVDAGGIDGEEFEQLWRDIPDFLRPERREDIGYYLCIQVSGERKIADYGSLGLKGGEAIQRVFTLDLLRLPDRQVVGHLTIEGTSSAPLTMQCSGYCNWESPLPNDQIIEYLSDRFR